MGGPSTATSPGIPLEGDGITIDGAGAGSGAGVGNGAGAEAGAAQAVNTAASNIKAVIINNLFISFSFSSRLLYKTMVMRKG
jgi:hypothetical protein